MLKKIKFITSALLIFITLIFIGEIYVWHIDSFELDYPCTTMFLQKDSTQQKMITDIKDSAQTYGVGVFVVEKKNESLFSQHIYIYAMQTAITTIEEDSNIKQGHFKSIFLGNVEVTILPFEDIPDISKIDTYYAIGSKDTIIAFKQSLVNRYAGRYPEFPKVTKESRYFVIIVWTVVFLVLLLLTLYEIAFLKKEVMIRVITGEDIHNIVFRNVMIDCFFYLFFFFISMSVLYQFANVLYCIDISVVCIVFFILLNSVLYLKIYKVDYKKDIATNQSAKTALNASYILKTVTVIMVIMMMSGNIEVVIQGLDFFRQNSFFKEHSDYSYLTISSDDFEETFAVNRLLYKTALEEGKTMALVNLGVRESDANYLLADHGAIEYLKSNIPDIKTTHFDSKVYFIIPKEDTDRTELIQEMMEIWESYYMGEYDYEIISYSNNANIIAIENIGKIESTMVQNPIIILNNLPSSSIESYWNIGYIANSTLYQYTSNEWENFVKNVGFESEIYYQTNAYENYIFQWQIAKRNLYGGGVLLVLLLLLESVVIKTILRFEHNVNATELALKKVFGYSIYDRYKKILVLTGILGILSISCAVVVCHLFELASSIHILIGGMLMILLEIIFITISICKMERWNIQRILKGERV